MLFIAWLAERSIVFAAMAYLFSGSVTSHAQSIRSTLNGAVTDKTGGAIGSAQVRLQTKSTPDVVTRTDEAGRFSMTTTLRGAAEVSVSSAGFAPQKAKVELMAGTPTSVSIVLEPAQLSQAISVEATVSTIMPEEESSATRLNVPLMSLPQSVSIVTNQLMFDQGVTRTAEALRNVAGVAPASSYSGTYDYLTLRGFQQSQVSSYFRDGARFIMLANLNIAAAEQVEMVKGPASILYGNVIPGGVINIISKKPREQFHHEFSYRPGSFNSHEFFADSTGPLWASKQLFYRLNTYGRNADSFRDYVYNDGYLLNPSLSWRPFNRTFIRTDLEYDRLFTINDMGIPAPDNRTVGSAIILPRSRFFGYVDGPFRSLRRLYDLNIRQELPHGWVFRADYNYNNFMRDTHMVFNSSLTPSTGSLQQQYFGHNLFYNTTFGRIDLTGTMRWGKVSNTIVIGGDTLTLRSQNSGQINVAVRPINIYNPDYSRTLAWRYGPGQQSPTKQRQIGGYFQDLLSLPYGFSVLVGGRYSDLEQTAPGQRTVAHQFNPTVGLLYRPFQWISLYGSYARSFDPVAGQDFLFRPFAPSQGIQTEAGVKTRFKNGKLTASFAWFDIKRTNVTTPDPINAGFLIQSGRQGSRGQEIEVRGEVRRNWQLIGTYTHLNATVLRDNRFPIGNFLPNAPRHTASLWGVHQFAGKLAPLSAGLGIFGATRAWNSIANQFQAPGYATVDSNISWRFEKHYKVQFLARNLFDRRYYTGATNILSLYPAAPRNFQAAITATF